MKPNLAICLLAGVVLLISDGVELRAADGAPGYQLAQTRRARRARPKPPGFVVPELGQATTEAPTLSGAPGEQPAATSTPPAKATSPAGVNQPPSVANTQPVPVKPNAAVPVPRVNNPAPVEEPPAPGIPAIPAPAARPENTAVQPERPSAGRRAAEAFVSAQQQFDAQNYEEAIRGSSQAIALDEGGAATYRKLRSAAYAALGRYEEALADQNPLELSVTSPRAQLKTGTTVLATVPEGTKLKVDDVKGQWLKVAAADEQAFDWAWVRRNDVLTPNLTEPQPLPQRGPFVTGAEPEPIGIPEAEEPGYEYYYTDGPGPGENYGRDHYDWWRHVPPPYWRYLPR